MKNNHFKKTCCFFNGVKKRCMKGNKRGHCSISYPLHEACSCSKLKVCSVNGDRKTCAQMANLGLTPGKEIELLCKGGGNQCMVKINGGTISLDDISAANIQVAPV